MWRLLFQIFPIAIFTLTSIFLMVHTITFYFFNNQLENTALSHINSQVMLLKDYLNPELSPQEWQHRFEQYQQIYQGKIEVVPLAALTTLSEEKIDLLMAGEPVSVITFDMLLNSTAHFYYRVGNTDKVINFTEIEPTSYKLTQFSFHNNINILIIIIVFISIWLSFHWSELKKLINATEQISRGNFSARVALNRYASTYLIGDKVNQMANYIERLINGQRELIHSVSHELRTPISRLEFGLEMLQELSKNPALEKRIGDLKQDVMELSDLVNELLQLAAVGQQYLTEPRPFDMSVLLHSSLNILQHGKIDKKITAVWPEDLGSYTGDERLLERAIRNLLTNADKYSRSQIRLSARRLPGGIFEINIDDDGPGIPEEEQQHIFEPFYRLENTWDKKISGYGLGLAIVHKVIMVHNGKITVTTSNLGGARFTILLSSPKSKTKVSKHPKT